jgi:hypothetical protein
MWKYHSTYNIEKALKRQRWQGIAIGRREVNKYPHCDFHPEQPLIVIAPGLFACQECRQMSQPMPVVRPTVRLFPDVERHTDRIKLPAQVFSQARNNGAGQHTAVSAAIPKNVRGKIR